MSEDLPTPRVDAEVERLRRLRYHETPQINPQVGADFARTLEKQLAETERLRFEADAARRQLRCELSSWKACAERLAKAASEFNRAWINQGGAQIEYLAAVDHDSATALANASLRLDRASSAIQEALTLFKTLSK